MSGWLETLNGIEFRLPEMDGIILIDDIAHGLSNQCRFNGQCNRFYSVAEHSYHVSFLVSPEHAMEALLHDATEAYMGDLISPLKEECPQFKLMEERLWRKIAIRFGLSQELPAEVKMADTVMLINEARQLMRSRGENWGQWLRGMDPKEVPTMHIFAWNPDEARRRFLERFEELERRRAA